MKLGATGASLLTTVEEGGSLLRVTLARAPGNIIDRAMIRELRAMLSAAQEQPELRAVLLHGAGKHFSFGASVEEHQAEQVAALLSEFHDLFAELADSGKVLLAAVHGMCLGGGLELALACHRIFAAPEASLGQPEIKLGVFAPAASLLLPRRIGQPRADELLLSGRTVIAEEALTVGLVDSIAEDPVEAARGWHRQHLLPLSGAALRHAVQAARWELRQTLDRLPELERLYLDELMRTHDAAEGLRSFLEKKEPQWTHR